MVERLLPILRQCCRGVFGGGGGVRSGSWNAYCGFHGHGGPDHEYLIILNWGGLAIPSPSLGNYMFGIICLLYLMRRKMVLLALSRLWGVMWAVSKVESLAHAPASPSEVYPAGKLQRHFTCGFDFRHSLWLSFVAAFSALKGLIYQNWFREMLLNISFIFDGML